MIMCVTHDRSLVCDWICSSFWMSKKGEFIQLFINLIAGLFYIYIYFFLFPMNFLGEKLRSRYREWIKETKFMIVLRWTKGVGYGGGNHRRRVRVEKRTVLQDQCLHIQRDVLMIRLVFLFLKKSLIFIFALWNWFFQLLPILLLLLFLVCFIFGKLVPF